MIEEPRCRRRKPVRSRSEPSDCGMLTIQQDHTRVVAESGGTLWAVGFHPDGKHFFGGTQHGIQRWRVADGQEVGKQTGMDLNAISVSRDGKWVVCGTTKGTSVWDAELQRKVVEVEDENYVTAADASPESTRFATATGSGASIWSITTGERLVGPLGSNTATLSRESSSSWMADALPLAVMTPSTSSTVTMDTSTTPSRTPWVSRLQCLPFSGLPWTVGSSITQNTKLR